MISDQEVAEANQKLMAARDAGDKAGLALVRYKKAMRQLGVDYNDPEALYAFTQDDGKRKEVDELFHQLMGA